MNCRSSFVSLPNFAGQNMMDPREIRIEDFSYELSKERIAKYPLNDRSASRLVIDNGEEITESGYSSLSDHLPAHSLLFLNDTRVFHARMIFRKSTGASIEIFCLEPIGMDFQQAFGSKEAVSWTVLIGNARRWKDGSLKQSVQIDSNDVIVTAERVNVGTKKPEVRISWDRPELSFGELIDAMGRIPIPPYLHRESEESDKDTYQTVYAREKGSVAAPTAGLHFTPELLNELQEKGHSANFLTLHVGAGTFKPVVESSIGGHSMHAEHFEVDIDLIRLLRDHHGERPVMAVGTTSVRTLESLYWLGMNYKAKSLARIDQWQPYDSPSSISLTDSLSMLIREMESHGQKTLQGITRLMIVPGYQFRVVDGMLTNFHQPQSTLLLLVSAFSGKRWKQVYDYALQNDFRFLSYGDACLFLPR